MCLFAQELGCGFDEYGFAPLAKVPVFVNIARVAASVKPARVVAAGNIPIRSFLKQGAVFHKTALLSFLFLFVV
ncbi:MAG: hypothetical protein IJN59_02765 [Oscillospiraceae bacterium]|nr:hypothetical protein [Oscillospiraceae bacterium]